LREALLKPQENNNIGKISINKINRNHKKNKSFDEIESDNENIDKIQYLQESAIKLLTIKYNFEKKQPKINSKKEINLALEKTQHNSTKTMQDAMKNFGNLKPKQEFITFEDFEKNEDSKNPTKEEQDKIQNETEQKNDEISGTGSASGTGCDDEEEMTEEMLKNSKKLSSYAFM